MSFLDRAKLAYSVLTTKQLRNSIGGSVMRNYSMGSSFNPHSQVRGITYKAIDKIGQSVSVYEPIVKRANGDPMVNHPINALFNRPNTIETSSSNFIHLWAMQDEIYGETFWYLARGESTRKVKEVYLLDPAQVEVKVSNGELVGYILHKPNGQQVPFELDELYHDKRPNPFNEFRGMSVLERASVYVDTELTTSSFTLNYMRNNASPSGIVSLPDMDKETFKQFARQWREGYEGPENAGKTAFIRGGEASFKAVGATLKDVDQKITREMAEDDVLMMFEVPKPLLGLTDGNGFGRGNLEALHYIFSREKLEPMMKRLDHIWEEIARMGGLMADASDITHESPIPEDKEFELQRHTKGVNVWITVNEAREQEGLPPIAGGDVLIPENRAPITNSFQPKKKLVLKKKITQAEIAKKLNNEQEEFRSKLVETNDIYAKKLKSVIDKFATKQEKEVIERFNASTKSFEEWLFNVKDQSEKLALILTPIILDLIEAQGEDVVNFITGEALEMTPELRQRVNADMLKIAGLYNEETLKALQETLAEGTANNESLAKLKKRVEQSYVDAKGYRAERIARTESLKSSNLTAEEVYKQNGFTTVRWFTNPGACEFCRTFEGRTKTIGTNFVAVGDVVTADNGDQMRIDYSDIGTPPLHPNCTCSLVPED